MEMFDNYLELKDLADYFEDTMTSLWSDRSELIEFTKKYLKDFDVAVIGATGANSNQVVDFNKDMDADSDRVYYICYLIVNTLRAASLRVLKECSISIKGRLS